jgi:hypothetical protein
VAAPGLPHPGAVVRAPVELLDVYPTIVELAGCSCRRTWTARASSRCSRTPRGSGAASPAPGAESSRPSGATRCGPSASATRCGRTAARSSTTGAVARPSPRTSPRARSGPWRRPACAHGSRRSWRLWP